MGRKSGIMSKSYRSLKVPEETWVKIVEVRGYLERSNHTRVTLWEAVDTVMDEVLKQIKRVERKRGALTSSHS